MTEYNDLIHDDKDIKQACHDAWYEVSKKIMKGIGYLQSFLGKKREKDTYKILDPNENLDIKAVEVRAIAMLTDDPRPLQAMCKGTNYHIRRNESEEEADNLASRITRSTMELQGHLGELSKTIAQSTEDNVIDDKEEEKIRATIDACMQDCSKMLAMLNKRA